MLLGWKAFLLRKMTHFCFSAKHTAGDRLWFGKQQNILDLFLKVRWSGNIKLMQWPDLLFRVEVILGRVKYS